MNYCFVCSGHNKRKLADSEIGTKLEYKLSDRQGYVITDKDFKDAIERDNKIHVESEDKE